MRNHSLDIAKAICIILMVVGHSGCPTHLRSFIYMFHMPCFFFISGYLLNDKYLTDVKRGLVQKARGSYYPFVKWTLIFILLHNIFTYLHISRTYYSWSDLIERIIRAFTLTGSESILGGFWFLISLCISSIASLLFLSILSKRNGLTIYNILGGWNCFAFYSMYMEMESLSATSDVRGADPYGNGFLPKRILL